MGEEQDQNDKQPTWPRTEHDSFLEWLVAYCDDYDLPFGITVTVGGLIVSGNLISGRRYFERTVQVFAERLDVELPLAPLDPQSTEPISGGEAFVRMFDNLREMVEQRAQQRQEVDIEAEPEKLADLNPRYIHLQDVRMVRTDGGLIHLPQSSLWRARLEAVDSLMLGQLTLDPNEANVP